MLTLPSEPQTGLMEPLPSIPPSFVNYGLSGSRRSPRKHQHVTERRANPKPYERSLTRPRINNNNTVSHNVPSRAEKTPRKEPKVQERLDFSVSSEKICDQLTRPQISSSQKHRLPLLTESTLEASHVCSKPSAPDSRSLLAPDSRSLLAPDSRSLLAPDSRSLLAPDSRSLLAPDSRSLLAPDSRSLLAPDSASRGWVIGPLFQSFKSKMASFTEIVMSPFKSNQESSENTTEGYVTAEEEAETEVEAPEQPEHQADIEKSPPKRVKITEEKDLNRETLDDSDTNLHSDVVPLQFQTEHEASVTQSAWNSSTTTITTAFTSTAATLCDVNGFVEVETEMRGPKARKRPNKATAKATEVGDCSEQTQQNVKDCNALKYTDSEVKQASDFISKDDVGESQADQTPTSPSILEDESLKKVKRTLDLSEDSGKRKKTEAQEKNEADEKAEPVPKRKPKRNEIFPNADETTNTVTKAKTRSNNKKSKAEREEDAVLTVNNENNMGDLTSLMIIEDTKSAKAKAKPAKRTKSKADQSSLLQTSLAVTPPEALTTVTKPTEKTVTAKKRKAKDNSSARLDKSEVTVTDQNEKAAESTKKRQKMKKTKMAVKEMAEGEEKVSRKTSEKVYFEMTPSEGDAAQVLLSDEATVDRGVTKRRARRMDPQRRRCRAIHGSKSPTKRSAELSLGSMTRGDSEAFHKGSSTRLKRSVSCPEIPTLRLHETPWTPHFHSPPRSRSQPPQQQHAAPHSLSSSSAAHHFHRSVRRARRHTVCSVEVEREIAPLCLRKEVYPTRRSPSPYDPQHLSPMRTLSPGASLSALASCFLSSPLAFLSKKSESGAVKSVQSLKSGTSSPTVRALSPNVRALSPTVRALSPTIHSLSPTVRLLSPNPAVLKALAASPSPSSPSSLSSLLGTSLGQLPGFHLRTDTLLNASADSTNSSSVALLCGSDPAPPPEEDEDTASSSPESEELREESAHSDSELKVLKKDHGHRKVSSIKIRKALPKPQNNLTPMGLPKAVRVKKKEFSLEEIYTNKNFSKPPESRLETIFEVPLNRKNGSESWCGPRRVKRFLEFPELGEPRRTRKPPLGATKANTAKANATKGNGANSRPRRGGCREDPALASDPDSVLCAKLEQLGAWLRQNDS